MQKLAQGFNTAAQDSNPGSLSRESGGLPLSHCALQLHTNLKTLLTRNVTTKINKWTDNPTLPLLWTTNLDPPSSPSVVGRLHGKFTIASDVSETDHHPLTTDQSQLDHTPYVVWGGLVGVQEVVEGELEGRL